MGSEYRLIYIKFCLFSEGYFRRVCEHQAMLINCGSKAIEILSASYGRHQQGVCGNGGTMNCHAGTSMKVARKECQGLKRCVLYATNSEFGDPCHGTFKYLEVSELKIGSIYTPNLIMCRRGPKIIDIK